MWLYFETLLKLGCVYLAEGLAFYNNIIFKHLHE
jgi:hypothetical protein